MGVGYGVIDRGELTRLHQRASEAAQRANENPDDDTAYEAAQRAVEVYSRGLANYRDPPQRREPTVTERVTRAEEAGRRQQEAIRPHRIPPSEAELYARAVPEGLGDVAVGIAGFPVEVARTA